MKPASPRSQKGVTLIVGLIMLVLITLMVTTSFTLSSTSLKAVGNMQFRNESIAAANKAIEQVIGTNFAAGFANVPPAQSIAFDINNDGVTDYTIAVAAPACIQSTEVAGSGSEGACSSATLEGFSGCGSPNYSTLWDIQAKVTDAVSGTDLEVHQGLRVELSSDQKASMCP
ncbi:Tfp pilus assembly protein PilX [Polaromonas sp. CG_9.5]|uniref:pilus assembly PilX family protein n=1 Tax=Polaromonas sp. CG_9.5 TaxID=3071705 RepID=UPI002DF9A048|nr:Tfp pilus assembly protein PilX [Polaromonas sp. CG_9.5]